MSDLIAGFISVWTPSVTLTVLLGGFGSGVVASYLVHPTPASLRAARWYTVHTVTMLTVITALFYVGRLVTALLDNDPLWGRVVGAFALQLLFSVVIGLGVALGLRLRLRRLE